MTRLVPCILWGAGVAGWYAIRYPHEARARRTPVRRVNDRVFELVLLGISSLGLLVVPLAWVMTGWPGLGPLLLEASMSRDLYVVVGVVMASTLFMVLGNLLADVMLVIVDPRVRTD